MKPLNRTAESDVESGFSASKIAKAAASLTDPCSATTPAKLCRGTGLDRAEYAELKEARGEVLWKAIEEFIPDIRERSVYSAVGTPLTHERYLRREGGTYGAAWKAGEKSFPGHSAPFDDLYCCGDSTFPGIGVPAVCGSGIAVAHAIAPVEKHLKLLDNMRKAGTLS